MITILGVSVLIIGTVLSILEIFVKDKEKRTKKWLSILYVASLIIGICLVIFQNNSENELNKLVGKISISTDSIKATVSAQIVKLNNSVKNTDSIIWLSKFIRSNLDSASFMNDSLFSQYKIVNQNLNKQIDYKRKELKNEAPKLNIFTSNLHWVNIDSSNVDLSALLTNLGKREASVFKTYELLIQLKKNKIIPIKSNLMNIGFTIYPKETSGDEVEMKASKDFMIPQSTLHDNYAILILFDIWYIDNINNDTLTQRLYYQWDNRQSFIFTNEKAQQLLISYAKREGVKIP